MSVSEAQSKSGAARTALIDDAPPQWLARFDQRIEALGELLNPILVKECRQALKSRQFLITFSLVLLCGWLWSIIGLALLGPGVSYSFDGPEMFYGYYIILAFPLMIIVPYGAFRSLAGEREDRTYELLSITTLKPRQIISGKLASAVVQMLVYYSAISPCLAFTYLLRGIDIVTILFVLLYLFVASLALSLLALLIATISRERHWQIVLSVIVVVGLAFVFMGSLGIGHVVLSENPFSVADQWFWIGHAAAATTYASTFALLFCAAAAQLTFPSDNRSTALRVCMVAQHVLFAGWMAYAVSLTMTRSIFAVLSPEPLFVYMSMAAIYWFVMGSFMTGESPNLSPRVQRGLPQSGLARALFTWFNPGPGTGYVFALANVVAAVLFTFLGMWIWSSIYGTFTGRGPRSFESEILIFGALVVCYFTIYLGLGKLVLAWLRRRNVAGVLTSLVTNVLLVLLGCGVPLVIHLMSDDIRMNTSYRMLHITNPIYTAIYAVDRPASAGMETITVLAILTCGAVVVLLLNARSIVYEARRTRVAQPKRVTEEEAELTALHSTLAYTPTNPWDEGA
jgi:ABC-2 family transporter